MGDPLGWAFAQLEDFADSFVHSSNAQIDTVCKLADGEGLVLLQKALNVSNFCRSQSGRTPTSRSVTHHVCSLSEALHPPVDCQP